jgi:hypothetical protein
MPIASLPDGTDALMAELSFSEVMRLIERTAKWVAPETFSLLPIWYPEHARQALFYKANWSEPQMNTNGQTGISSHKSESNYYANQTLAYALGLKSGSEGKKGWTCCHIWGVDDSTYQQANVVVQDPRFYSCVANMVLLPTPLKTFTDTVPAVKAMLRICARNTYGWQCDHEIMDSVKASLDVWDNWEGYPESWPRKIGTHTPIGTMPFNSVIQKRALNRWKKIQNDIENAGPFYPRDSVRQVLKYWDLDAAAPLKLMMAE